MDRFDLIVVGTGWYGLAAAKTYIGLHPSENVAVLEANTSVGGVWAQDRLYPGLKSNNMLGTYEYPDFPMNQDNYGVKPGEHIPGTVLHRYLTDYAEKFGVLERTRFNTRVDSVEPTKDGGWLLKTSSPSSVSATAASSEQEISTFETKKLIVATGLTSQPYIPDLPGMENFEGPLFHARDFAKKADTIAAAKSAVVVGGAKSAWDVAYAYATAGVQVDMVIRESGRGPVWMAPPYVTPLKKWLEKLVHTRFLTWLSPCIWGAEDGYSGIRNFLHSTFLGRGIVSTFWKILASDVIALNKYDSHPELKKLKPWDPAFYVGSSLSIHNYPTSFFDLVREGKVRVHIDEVVGFGPHSVSLKSGDTLRPDVVVLATGWKKEPTLQFVAGSEADVGLHHSPADLEDLAKEADREILRKLPSLNAQPQRRHELEEKLSERMHQPLRMYRFTVPPAMVPKQNIAFAGMLSCITTSTVATVQALWICAFFDGNLSRLPSSQDDIRWQTVLHTQFGKWRYPTSYGPSFPDFVFDAVPYLDMLLNDLNLNSHRKPGKMADIFDPYGPEDYVGLVDEWKAGREKTERA
ncbi:Flavin-binding monooxygenase-like family protein [Cladophialophora carrionii]|uniref:Flavin-binding monooxygenase-like family protein n=1 Tax=Cladophialophora carrionii TaxID=86049 RepID=A0A1C1CVB3_9EURO|nr:Flavin-binding monooxygenase-like family protein [Cladophialophora carrionii]